MKLKTSLFNCGLIKSNLKRFWPLYLAYFTVLLLSLPMYGFNNGGTEGEKIIDSVNSYLGSGSAIFAFITAIVSAMCVYSFLYTQKTCGMVASLPLKRKTIFASSAASGVFPIVGINLIVALITAVPLIDSPDKLALEALIIWFAVTSLHYIAFFGIASIIAVITGSTVALPVFYGIFNFLAVGLETAFIEVFSYFIYGFSNSTAKLNFEFLSPLIYMDRSGLVLDYVNQFGTVTVSVVYYKGWQCAIIYAVVGLALIAAANFIFRKRKMENCGDVIAVPSLRPVFKYGVALCVALCAAILLRGIFGTSGKLGLDSGMFLAYLIIGAFIGYFGSEMLLKKRFNVFKGNWLGFIILSVLCTAFIWCCVTDYAGIGSRTPEADEVESVELDGSFFSSSLKLSEEDSIENVLALNESIIENKDTHLNCGDLSTVYFRIYYNLVGGGTVSREYEICTVSGDYKLFENIIGSDEAREYMISTSVEMTPENVQFGSFNCCDPDTDEYIYIDLTPEQVVDFFIKGYAADVKAGCLSYYDYSEAYVEIQLVFPENNTGEIPAQSYFTCYISPDCQNSIQWVLDNLGIDLSE